MGWKKKTDITVRYIPNILADEGRRLASFPYNRTWTVRRYLKKSGFDFKGMRVTVNSNPIKSLSCRLDSGDEILVAAPLEGPIGAVIGWLAEKFILHWFTYTMIAISVATTVYSVVSALSQRARLPDFGTLGDGLDEGSPTYSWDGPRTTADVGRPIPIIYGTMLVGGNVINEYVSTSRDKNYLNSLVEICEGEVDSITLARINKNPAANYSNYTLTTRLGTNTQTIIKHFGDLHNVKAVGVLLSKNTPHVYTTEITDAEAFELRFQLPGLWQQNAKGTILSWAVTLTIEYKLHSAEDYVSGGTLTITDKSRTTLERVLRIDELTAGQYDIRITKTSENSDFSHNGDTYLHYVDEINTDDLVYPNSALAGVRTLAIEQLNGNNADYEFLVRGTKVMVPKVMNGAVEVGWDDYYWDPTEEAYRILSDDTILTWNGTTYVTRYSANPIWCSTDLLTNKRYGLGRHIVLSDADLDHLVEQSQYCDERVPDGAGGWEKRFRMDIAIDSPQKALRLIMQLATIFRGMPSYTDQGKIRIAIDKPDTPVQLFNMGNIAKASFSGTWGSRQDIPTHVEVQFNDQDKNYELDSIEVEDPVAVAAGTVRNGKSVRYYGTKLSYAIRHGRNIIKAAKLSQGVKFRSGIGAIVRRCGEVIDVAHDVPQYGFSGTVKTGSTTTVVKLDRSVTIEEDKSYKILVDQGEGKMEERTVTDSPGTYTQVTVSGSTPFSPAPQENDKYSFGESTKFVKPFRISSLKRLRNFETDIEAVEYNASAYDDSTVIIPDTNYSALSDDIPDVEALALTERIVKLQDGTIENVIDVWFKKPDVRDYCVSRYAKARVYLSDNAGASWEYKGEVISTHFEIVGNILEGQAYTVAVVSVTAGGNANAVTDSPQDSITITGKTEPPSDIANFEVSQKASQLLLSWDPVTDVDLARYVIKKGVSWPTGQIIAELIDATEFQFPVGQIGTQTYMIKAVDTSGNGSVNPAYDIIIVTRPPDMNFLNEYDFFAQNIEYALTNCELVYRADYDPAVRRRAIALNTATTWEEKEALGQSWETLEAAGLTLDSPVEASGSFEMVTPIDLGTIFEFNLILDIDFQNITGGNVVAQVNTSEDGASWSGFADVSATQVYRTRYLKFRFNLTTSDTNFGVYFYGATVFINAPVSKLDWGRDVAIPLPGLTIPFGVDFTSPPRVVASIVNGVAGFIKITKTADDFTARVYSDVALTTPISTAEIDWDAKGS